MRSRFFLTAAILLAPLGAARADVMSTFEDLNVPPNSFVRDAGGGADGRFVSAGNAFNNVFSPSFGGIWSGWAISTETKGTTPGFENQYSAKPGKGAGGSSTYAVGFPLGETTDPFHPAESFVDLVAGTSPISIDVTNTAYAYYAIQDGYLNARKFVAGDFYRLDVEGFDGAGGTGNSVGVVEFYLADYRDGKSLIVADWTTLDLSTLAGARSLRFGASSTDNDSRWGINTPAYFAVDNLRLAAVPEPSSVALLVLGLGVGLAYRRRRA